MTNVASSRASTTNIASPSPSSRRVRTTPSILCASSKTDATSTIQEGKEGEIESVTTRKIETRRRRGNYAPTELDVLNDPSTFGSAYIRTPIGRTRTHPRGKNLNTPSRLKILSERYRRNYAKVFCTA